MSTTDVLDGMDLANTAEMHAYDVAVGGTGAGASAVAVEWAPDPVVLTESGVWAVLRPRSRGGAHVGVGDRMSRPPIDETETDNIGEGGVGDGDDPETGIDDTSAPAYRAARASRMSSDKKDKLRRLSEFLRTQRAATGMTQAEAARKARGFGEFTESFAPSYVMHLETLATNRNQSNDVGLFKILSYCYALNTSLADLEAVIAPRDERETSEQARLEQALLTAFRGLTRQGKVWAIQDVQTLLQREMLSSDPYTQESRRLIEQGKRAANEAYDREHRPRAAGDGTEDG